MSKIQSFGIIGGDKRQLYCGKSMEKDGYRIVYSGFEKICGSFDIDNTPFLTALKECDALILPLPCSRDGKTVNCPLADTPLAVENLKTVIGQKPVFCGMKNKLTFHDECIYDYAEGEAFAVENAVPTGEGAIELAMREYDGTIHGSRCLVTGYGRIGRILSAMLKGLGADVTVSARNERDLAYIRSAGMKAIHSERLAGQFDLIFNTVPHVLFDSRTLAASAVGSVLIDLASMPGGVDHEGAQRLSVPVLHALSLPGKAAPKTSGIIIKNAVYHIIREEGL